MVNCSIYNKNSIIALLRIWNPQEFIKYDLETHTISEDMDESFVCKNFSIYYTN